MSTTSQSAGKTPISLLQELCTKRGITPTYDLVNIDGPVHEPKFVYRVTVGELCANGQGCSKKKAKHHAAKNALDKISGNPETYPVDNIVTNTSTASPIANGAEGGAIVGAGGAVVGAGCKDSPSSGNDPDGAAGNPIGALQELTMMNHWPPPLYKVITERGQPHNREFVIAVSIHRFCEEGSGHSKKVAKRVVALQMLKRMQSMPTGEAKVKDEEDAGLSALSLHDSALGAGGWYGYGGGRGIGDTPTTGKLASQFVASVQKLPSSLMTQVVKQPLSECLKTMPECLGNARVLLDKITQEQQMDMQYMEIPEKNVQGQVQCLVQLGMQPVAVVGGTGATMEEAQIDASLNALHYLSILVRCAVRTNVKQHQMEQPLATALMGPVGDSTSAAAQLTN